MPQGAQSARGTGRHPVSRTEGPAAAPATNARQWEVLGSTAASAFRAVQQRVAAAQQASDAHRCLPKSAAIPIDGHVEAGKAAEESCVAQRLLQHLAQRLHARLPPPPRCVEQREQQRSEVQATTKAKSVAAPRVCSCTAVLPLRRKHNSAQVSRCEKLAMRRRCRSPSQHASRTVAFISRVSARLPSELDAKRRYSATISRLPCLCISG